MDNDHPLRMLQAEIDRDFSLLAKVGCDWSESEDGKVLPCGAQRTGFGTHKLVIGRHGTFFSHRRAESPDRAEVHLLTSMSCKWL